MADTGEFEMYFNRTDRGGVLIMWGGGGPDEGVCYDSRVVISKGERFRNFTFEELYSAEGGVIAWNPATQSGRFVTTAAPPKPARARSRFASLGPPVLIFALTLALSYCVGR